ncbi:probable helicase CHR10 isoform X6 [Phoenix dactylifera]|uniref:Probable helicase CHR10 isoform X6 n=1 Tax=Phoenix dactylifera TaxID=42345 RepID=A0A8B8ZXN6_PHODC|nr:probable helicase CHR10 isoform X6 [Phoenix dactylifera]
MEYERRLVVAAELVLSSDRRDEGRPPLDPSDIGVSAALKPHQLEGVAWLVRRYELGVNVVLGDEMGLGKTLQAISFLNYLKIQSMSRGPFLILCPLSVTDGWESEFSKFCPTLRVLHYVGEKGHRCGLRRMMYEHLQRQSTSSDQQELSFDVLLTTYDIALLDRDFLSQIPWHFAVIDEAQRLKNSSSVLYKVLEQHFVMPRRLLLTGTPIQNNLSELWALMHFCMPSIFGTLEQFLFTFKEAGNSSPGDVSDKAKRQLKILKYILRAFMLRRTKALLVKSGILMLPPLTEITVLVPLVSLQKKVYMSILRRELPTLLALSSGTSSHQSLQNIVIQLRKACSHPYLFNGIEPEPYEEGEHLIQASGKLIILDQLLQKLHARGHRVLLFAQMTHTLDVLQDFLELRNFTYERLDGSVRAEERFAAIRSFSQQTVKVTLKHHDNQNGAFIFLVSTRAGGVGLNLVAADTVIMRRAERKFHLSNCVVGQENEVQGAGKDVGFDSGDMRSLIFGLQIFDPADLNKGTTNGENMVQLNAMTERVLKMRSHEPSDKDDHKCEINPRDMLNSTDVFMRTNSAITSFDPELDEASYLSWVEKFKEVSQATESSTPELEKRRYLSEEKQLKHEADRKKAEEKKSAKWEALGYQSLAVKDPDFMVDNNMMSDVGSIQFVYGDCTDPSKICPMEPAIIFSCVDTSGNWGHGGMFDALASLSTCIPDAYHRAFECGDLHLGDLHLIKINGTHSDKGDVLDVPLWVALAVVQSYNPRRKVPRSDISITDFERCLSKASFSAAQNSASIHMPRIGYGSQHSEWYTVERLLRKYASIHGIKVFVYYFRRPSKEQ